MNREPGARHATSGIAITGSRGFIGTGLKARLRAEGLPHSILERSDYTSETAYANADVVVHLAGLAHRKSAGVDDYLKVNCDLAVAAAKAAAKAGVRRFIYISSSKALREFSPDDEPLDEHAPEQPGCSYGHSKHQAELSLLALHQQGLIEVVILRPALVLGAPAKANLRLLAKAADSVWAPLLGRFFSRFTARKSFTSLENLCDAILLVARHPGAAGKIFHIVETNPLSTHELFQRLCRAKLFLKTTNDFDAPLTADTSGLRDGAKGSPAGAHLVRWAFSLIGRQGAYEGLSAPLVLSGTRFSRELGTGQLDRIDLECRRIMQDIANRARLDTPRS